jgi:hypothetical protein
MRYIFRLVLVAGLLASLAGCWNSADDRIPVARQDPESTVRLAQDLFMQKQFAATEMLFTPKFVSGLTDNGKRSYGEIQRKQAELVAVLLGMRFWEYA